MMSLTRDACQRSQCWCCGWSNLSRTDKRYLGVGWEVNVDRYPLGNPPVGTAPWSVEGGCDRRVACVAACPHLPACHDY